MDTIVAVWRLLFGPPSLAPVRPSPRVLGAYAALARYGGSTTDLEPRLRLLATQLAAERSRCRWCIDKGRHLWREAHLPVDVLRALPRYETSPLFSIRERATLRFTEAITHCTATGGDGPLLEPLAFVRQHLSEPEIAAVTAAVAEMHFFNPITGELGADADGEPSPAPTCRSAWGAPIGTSLRSFWL